MTLETHRDVQESQLVLLVDDDVGITEALAAGLEREGRTIITCNDIESAELIVQHMRPSHVVADIRFSGPFAFEGLDFIHYVKRHAPEGRIILISGNGTEELQLEASQRGAVAFLQKPFDVKQLDATLDMISCSAMSSAGDYGRLIRIPPFDEIILSDALRPFFQPIVTLGTERASIGYESLARFREESPMRNAEMLFRYAERKQRVADLEFACIGKTLLAAAALPGTAMIFMNIHPEVFTHGAKLVDQLLYHARVTGIAPNRIVLEITEQASLSGTPVVLQTIEQLRNHGVRFAFDDVGVAYSHLPLIGHVRPSFLKISQDFGTGFEADPTRTKIVMNILSLARDFNSRLILEGVEDESTAAAAAELGIPLGQGFLFSHPADAAAFRS